LPKAEFINVISLRFLGLTLKVLRLEVSMYNVYITNQFQAAFARGGGEGNLLVEVTENSKGGKLLRLLSQLRPRIRPLVSRVVHNDTSFEATEGFPVDKQSPLS